MNPKDTNNPQPMLKSPVYLHILVTLAAFIVLRSVYISVFYQDAANISVNVYLNIMAWFGYNIADGMQTVPYVLPSVIASVILNPVIFLIVVASSFLLFAHYYTLKWSNLEQGVNLRWFVIAVVGLLTWIYTTYDYNLYYDQAHYIDRITLIMLAVLIFFHPAFISLFLPALLLVISQFNYPLGGLSLTGKTLPLSILILFNSYLYLLVTRKIFSWFGEWLETTRTRLRLIPPFFKWFGRSQPMPQLFPLLLLSLYGASYFLPGVKKIVLSPNYYEWTLFNELYLHTMWAQTRGWLGFLDDGVRSFILSSVTSLGVYALVGTVLLELAGLFIITRRLIAILLLVGFCLMHLGIFVTSGIFFWEWIWCDVALIIFLASQTPQQTIQLFTIRNFVLSLLLISLSSFYFQPIPLGWYDTRFYNEFRLEATGVSGTVYNIDKNFMAPYHMFFTYGWYYFLVDEPLIRKAAYSYEVMQKIRDSQVTDVPTLKDEVGINYYNQHRTERFDEFIQTYFKTLNQRMNKDTPFSYLPSPHHLTVPATGNVYNLQEPVIQVEVRLLEFYYDGSNILVLQNQVVRTIRIP